jgi:hypothetical protein
LRPDCEGASRFAEAEIMIAEYVIVLTPAILIIGRSIFVYFKFRGTRLVTCPETQRFAGVEVDAEYAALASPISGCKIRLKHCSRWPERQVCDQSCLKQIASPREQRRVRTEPVKLPSALREHAPTVPVAVQRCIRGSEEPSGKKANGASHARLEELRMGVTLQQSTSRIKDRDHHPECPVS